MACRFSFSRVEDCVFDSNTASEGGGMRAQWGAPEIARCDFTGNAALSRGGGFSSDGFAVNGGGDPTFPVKRVRLLDVLTLRIHSPGGTFDGARPAITAQGFPTSQAPAGAFPGVVLDPNGVFAPFVLLDGGAGLPPGGLTLQQPLTVVIPGISALVQAFALTPSAANGIFASSDGHEIRP